MEEKKFDTYFQNDNNFMYFPMTNKSATVDEQVWNQFPKEFWVSVRADEKKSGNEPKSLFITIEEGTYLYNGTTSKEFVDNPSPKDNLNTFFGFFPTVAFWFAYRGRTKQKTNTGYLMQFITTKKLKLKVIGFGSVNDKKRCIGDKFDGCVGKMVVNVICGKSMVEKSNNDFTEFILQDNALMKKISPLRTFELNLEKIAEECKNDDFNLLDSITGIYKEYN